MGNMPVVCLSVLRLRMLVSKMHELMCDDCMYEIKGQKRVT